MRSPVFRLYPAPYEAVSVIGLYLSLNLHTYGTDQMPFVYANFLTSLDGRIALYDDTLATSHLPKTLTSHYDFRLFLELQCQADVLITHGGYLRSLLAGRLGNILQVGSSEGSKDLLAWRYTHGLSSQPAIVIASASLDFPMPDSIGIYHQSCLIATGRCANPDRVAYWRDRGYEVIFAGNETWVEGRTLMHQLGERGYRTLYLIAGPHMLDTMMQQGCLSTLFHTTTHRLMGGTRFHTVLHGSELGQNGHLKLVSLYYDPTSPEGTGQCFSQFETAFSSRKRFK